MANTYVNIPAAAAVGPGAAVDLSTFGGLKTLVSHGDFDGIVNIEINNTAGADADAWTSLATFAGVGLQTLLVAAKWVRANIVHYSSGTPQFNVGAPLLATTMLNLDVPAGNGSGVALLITAEIGNLHTIQCAGSFTGQVNIEVSTNGNTKWATLCSFQQPAVFTQLFIGAYLRVTRMGATGGGVPKINLGSTTDSGDISLPNMTPLSVLGRATETAGAPIDITATPADLTSVGKVIQVINVLGVPRVVFAQPADGMCLKGGGEFAIDVQDQNSTKWVFTDADPALGNGYLIDMLFHVFSDAAANFEFRFAVDAGVMDGMGTVVALDLAGAPAIQLIAAAAAANTNQVSIGTPSAAPVAIRVQFAFQPSVDTTFRFQFGCDTLGVGGFVIIGAGWMKITNRSL